VLRGVSHNFELIRSGLLEDDKSTGNRSYQGSRGWLKAVGIGLTEWGGVVGGGDGGELGGRAPGWFTGCTTWPEGARPCQGARRSGRSRRECLFNRERSGGRWAVEPGEG